MVKVREDLTGKVFERLKVVQQAEDYVYPNGKRKAQWLCQCSCKKNKFVVVCGDDLKCRKIKSCGCLKSENAQHLIEKNKKFNQYKILEEYGVGKYSNCNDVFLFSLQDLNLIKQYTWWKDKNGYPRAKINGELMRMHKFLGFIRHDHINRNKSDNRRENLRPATYGENKYNSSIRSDNNSGIIGVGWVEETSNWRVRIQFEGKPIYIGRFDNIKDAIKARLQAEAKYFGEFAPQQHLFIEYGIEVIK